MTNNDLNKIFAFFHDLINREPEIKQFDNNIIQLSKITLNEDYAKEWNERMKDFVVITKNGELVNNSLYRVGGLGNKDNGNGYFLLLKYVEAYYPEEILKMSKSKNPKHLEGRWCILDKNGVEKKVFERSLDYPSLIEGSCIYTINRKYYNIETDEFYCEASDRMDSKEFIFLNNKYDKDENRRGIWKIHKTNCTYEIIK